MGRRKQITYDIDTEIAKRIFGPGYRRIYLYIKTNFEKFGFTHIQGSVFHSTMPMNKTEVSFCINVMIKNCPGLEKCIRDIRVADITKENSLNYLFDYDGTLGKYPDKSGISSEREIEYER